MEGMARHACGSAPGARIQWNLAPFPWSSGGSAGGRAPQERVAADAGAYRYLAESIRVHPGQEELKALMEQAGLERVEYFNLAAGAVALHRGYRL